MRKCVFAVSLLLLAPLSFAQPNLKSQAAWTEKEKQEFLRYLKAGGGAQAAQGEVKEVAAYPSSRGPRKAGYLSLSAVTDTMVLDAPGGSETGAAVLAPKLLIGGHLFSWVRYYAGAKYGRIGAERTDGKRARLSHLELPAGIELALIPLGTPHTRYVLLRGGVSLHNIYGADGPGLKAGVKGWRAAWNLGLGYEWQIPDSRWRVNALAEGYRAFSSDEAPRYSGVGLGAGVAYTF